MQAFDSTLKQPATTTHPPAWGAVFSMALCVVVLIASEFMPVSLLTPIAQDLGVSKGQAGQAISISGFFAVLISLLNAPLTGHLDRKKVLLGFSLLLLGSAVIVTLASNGWMFMAGRALLGVAIGGFWSMSTATVMRLVPKKSVARGLALINGGNALAATVAAPLGSFMGQLHGAVHRLAWRVLSGHSAGGSGICLAVAKPSGHEQLAERQGAQSFSTAAQPASGYRHERHPIAVHGPVRRLHRLAPVSGRRHRRKRHHVVADAAVAGCQRAT
ncbi:MFS transporter [Pseudomonas coronafaciens]|uniref:MFS transporter n=1 Tax=Pseudomonas coronafaciens TaxID=53409 RepID=UPI000EFE5C5B|nr:MFS transporter [Pseudomonas coronafaciens]RMN28626.1 Major facilitator family transporter [Pseudomonas coronafaciens pv. zizaniae]